MVMVRVRVGLVRFRFRLGFRLGLDLHSWLLTHSWRSDAINFLLAYYQMADLTLTLGHTKQCVQCKPPLLPPARTSKSAGSPRAPELEATGSKDVPACASCSFPHLQMSNIQGRRWEFLTGGSKVRGSGGQKCPSGVQGQSPGRRSGGQSPPEAEALLKSRY